MSGSIAQTSAASARPSRCFSLSSISFLWSFETTFVLFVFAGRYKADPRFAWIPVDITLLTLAISVGVGGLVVLRRRAFTLPRRTLWLLNLFTAFATLIICSVAWSSSRSYGPTKAATIIVFAGWCLVATAVIIGPDEARVRRLMKALAAFSLWISLDVLLLYLREGRKEFAMELGGTYLGIGRVVGVGVIALVVLAATQRYAVVRWVSVILAALLLGILLIIGGRGPFLATLAPIACLILLSVRPSRAQVLTARRHAVALIAVLLLGGVAAAITMARTGLTSTVQRLELLTSGNLGNSAQTRVLFWTETIKDLSETPFAGHGIGSWPVRFVHVDMRAYPHNMILETAYELGAIGLILLLSQVFLAIANTAWLNWLRTSSVVLFAFLFLVNVGINAMVSGDLGDNRLVFAAIGLAAVVPVRQTQTRRLRVASGESA